MNTSRDHASCVKPLSCESGRFKGIRNSRYYQVSYMKTQDMFFFCFPSTLSCQARLAADVPVAVGRREWDEEWTCKTTHFSNTAGRSPIMHKSNLFKNIVSGVGRCDRRSRPPVLGTLPSDSYYAVSYLRLLTFDARIQNKRKFVFSTSYSIVRTHVSASRIYLHEQ